MYEYKSPNSSFLPSLKTWKLLWLWSQLAKALPNHSIHNSTVNSATKVFCHANQCDHDAVRQLLTKSGWSNPGVGHAGGHEACHQNLQFASNYSIHINLKTITKILNCIVCKKIYRPRFRI